MSNTMKAVGLYKYLPIDNPESLQDLEVPKPIAEGKDILVKIHAIGVNPVDTKVRAPKDKTEEQPKILGWDAAGIVEAVGDEVTLFAEGDEVYYAGSYVHPGSNAQYQLVDERIVSRKPARLTFAEAAALPLTTITAYESLFDRLHVSKDIRENKGKYILLIGAAGGVGSIAIQLAKLAGLKVIATASRKESMDWVKQLGADVIVNHHEDLQEQLKAKGITAVSYILCLNDTAKYWETMAALIAPQGYICSIVETKEPVNITLLKNKSATFAWEFMFARSMYQTEDMIEQHNLLNEVAGLIDAEKIKTTLAETLSPINAANLRKAHEKLESGTAIGKIVLENYA